ncbi:MAG: TRL domain-containing protein, partial [Bacteroidia bacterium]
MKKVIIIFVATFALVGTSCTRVFPGMVTTAASKKEGIAKKKVWFGIAKSVDVSLATAAKNGGITKIATV